jgi:hypothetical protein
MAEETTPATGEEDAAAKEAAEKKAAEEKAAAEKAAADPDAGLLAGARDPDAVRNALKAEREAAKAAKKTADDLAAKVKEFEDRDKSEQEKAEQRAVDAEKKAAEAEKTLLRLTVASKKKLPAELASRLQGETEEELKADADKLLKLVKAENSTGFDGGARTSADSGEDMNSRIRRAAGR